MRSTGTSQRHHALGDVPPQRQTILGCGGPPSTTVSGQGDQGRLINRKILNMLMNLQEFRFSVIYRDGLRHIDADAISRLLCYQDNGELHMLEMNGTSLPVTPDIPIALLRKISLDYEFCRPGDPEYRSTYYFHPLSATPGPSKPGPPA